MAKKLNLAKIILSINIFMIVGLVGTCAAVSIPYTLVDKELVPYYNHYKNTLNEVCGNKIKEPKQVIVELVDNLGTDSRIGECRYKINGYAISILKIWWDYTPDETKRLELMYHEATHCLLDKDHTDPKRGNNYMNPIFTPLSKGTFINQAIDDMKEACKNK